MGIRICVQRTFVCMKFDGQDEILDKLHSCFGYIVSSKTKAKKSERNNTNWNPHGFEVDHPLGALNSVTHTQCITCTKLVFEEIKAIIESQLLTLQTESSRTVLNNYTITFVACTRIHTQTLSLSG